MNIKNHRLKFLTSIFMALLIIFIFSPSSSYAVNMTDSLQPIIDFIETDSTASSKLSEFDNCYIYCTNDGYFYNNMYFVGFNNGNSMEFSASSNDNTNISVSSLNTSWGMWITYYRSGSISISADSATTSGGTMPMYNNSILDTFNYYGHVVKGNFNVIVNGEPISSIVPTYDFSFVIKDSKTNTEHNFDFNMIESTFSDGRTFNSDDIKEGHYLVSVSSYVHNIYDLGNNESSDSWWVSGYIDYVDYSDTTPKSQFFWSSGYNKPKILNESSEPIFTYRFKFKGYSSDTYGFEELENTNYIVFDGMDNYCESSKYNYPYFSTFAYSNHDIYWALDSSLYGFNGLTNSKFFDESEFDILSVFETEEVTYSSSSSDVNNNITTFALNNDVHSYPSSEVTLGNNGLSYYNGSLMSSFSPYSNEENITGTQVVAEDTSNWGVLDYVKHLGQLIANIPLAICNGLANLFIPQGSQLTDLLEDFTNFLDVHFGVLYDGIHFVIDLFNTLMEKYNTNYSYYYFTIPGVRWFNPVTGQKEVLVESQTIELGSMYMNDDDWFDFWNVTRYLTCFLIYINLIMMAYNKWKKFLGVAPSYSDFSSFIGQTEQEKYYQEYSDMKKRDLYFNKFGAQTDAQQLHSYFKDYYNNKKRQIRNKQFSK